MSHNVINDIVIEVGEVFEMERGVVGVVLGVKGDDLGIGVILKVILKGHCVGNNIIVVITTTIVIVDDVIVPTIIGAAVIVITTAITMALW